jgi:hypothetical protein
MAEGKRQEFGDLAELTRAATEKQRSVAFAGILVGEDTTSISVADPQGTWVIPRESVVSIDDWEHGDCAPPYMREMGRPVRVAISDGSTIHEIRPWKINRAGPGSGQERTVRLLIDSIFTLGGDGPPITDQTRVGERQLNRLERAYARRLGWNPEGCPGTDLGPPRPPGGGDVDPVSAGSKTWECPNDGNGPGGGGCFPDSDEPF